MKLWEQVEANRPPKSSAVSPELVSTRCQVESARTAPHSPALLLQPVGWGGGVSKARSSKSLLPSMTAAQGPGYDSASSSASLSPLAMGWAWLPEILVCKWCRQLWWCLPMPGSSSPGSVHTAEELLYKIRAATHSSEATKLLHCMACRVLTMPTIHPASKERNHPKRPLIPELSMAGAQAGQCPASSRSGWAELCCICRSAPQYVMVELSLTNKMYL